ALIAAITFRLWPSPVSEPKQVKKTEAPSARPKRPAVRPPKAVASAAVDACHDERLTAEKIRLDFVSGAAPEVQGGLLTSGVYDAVLYQVFGNIPEEVVDVLDGDHTCTFTFELTANPAVGTFVLDGGGFLPEGEP